MPEATGRQRHRLRFGVIGLGEFGEAYLAALRDLRDVLDIETVAVCSRSGNRAREMAEQYGIARWYDDPVAFAEDSEVDVVCVVTSEAEHADPVTRALQVGKHVIVEKPLATTLGEADALIALAKQAGRQLLVGHLLRFAPLHPQHNAIESETDAEITRDGDVRDTSDARQAKLS